MRGPKPLSTLREQYGERQPNATDSARVDIARRVNAVPFLNGRAVSVRFLASEDKVVNHGLGVPAAFFVIRHNYNGTPAAPAFDESPSSVQVTIDLNNQLAIICSDDCDVDLWFYPRASRTIDAKTRQSL